MIWDILENYLVILIIGIVIGIIFTRYYYERTKNYSIGKIFEAVMISNNVNDLRNYCNELDILLSKMRIESDTLMESINRCGDIERIREDVTEEESSSNIQIESDLENLSED